MDKQGKYERIESYLAGTLSDSERRAFESELSDDLSLAEEVALHQKAQLHLSDKKRLEMRELVQTVGKEYAANQPSKARNVWFLRVAAAFLILLSVSSAYWLMNLDETNRSEQELFADYYVPYPARHLQRTDPNAPTDSVKIALDHYTNKEFVQASAQLEALLVKHNEPIFHFYLGHCLLGMKQASMAIGHFESVVQEGNNYFVAQAEWYLALSLLANEQPDLAREALQRVAVNKGHSFHQEAGELLDALRTE